MKIAFVALWYFIAILSYFQGSVLAQNQRKIVLTDNQFKESFLEKVTVSGGIRAGFMYQSSLDHVDVHQLYIYLHRGLEDQEAILCVNMAQAVMVDTLLPGNMS